MEGPWGVTMHATQRTGSRTSISRSSPGRTAKGWVSHVQCDRQRQALQSHDQILTMPSRPPVTKPVGAETMLKIASWASELGRRCGATHAMRAGDGVRDLNGADEDAPHIYVAVRVARQRGAVGRERHREQRLGPLEILPRCV